MQSAGPRDREREARLRRSGPRDDAVRPKRAELVDELQIVVEAWCRWSAGRAIEQSGADAVANLATAALLVGRVHRIDSEVVQIDLAPRIDQGQRARAICPPERLPWVGAIVERPSVQFRRQGSEHGQAKVVPAEDDPPSVEARLDVHTFVVVDEPSGSVDEFLLAQSHRHRAGLVESRAEIDEGLVEVSLVLVDARARPGGVAGLLLILEGR